MNLVMMKIKDKASSHRDKCLEQRKVSNKYNSLLSMAPCIILYIIASRSKASISSDYG